MDERSNPPSTSGPTSLTASVDRARGHISRLQDEHHLPDEELARTATTVALAMGCEVASIYVADTTRRRLVLASTCGLSRSSIGHVTFDVGIGITGTAAARRAPVQRADVRGDPTFLAIPGFDQSRYRSILAVPMMDGDDVVGVLNVQSVAPHAYTESEVVGLTDLAAAIAPRLVTLWRDGDLPMRILGPGLLVGLGAVAAASAKLEEVCQTFLDAVHSAMPDTSVSVEVATTCGRSVELRSPSLPVGRRPAGSERGTRDVVTLPVGQPQRRLGSVTLTDVAPHWRVPHVDRWLETAVGLLGGAVLRIGTARPDDRPQPEVADHGRSVLIELVLADRGIDALIAEAAALTGSTMAVVDRSGGILAGTAPDTIVAQVDLRSGGTALGTLIVDRAVDGDASFAGVVEALSLELVKWRATFEVEARLRGDLLAAILSGDQEDGPSVAMRATFAGMDLTRTYRPVKLCSTPPRARADAFDHSALLRALTRHFGSPPGCVAFPANDGVLIVVDDAWLSTTMLRQRVQDVLDEHASSPGGGRMSCSIGAAAASMDGLRREVARTERTATVAARLGRTGPVTSADLGVDALLAVVADSGGLGEFVDLHLGPVLRHDERKKSQLLQTVDALFRSGDNLRLAADQLNVHVNTLRYRISRIEQLTGLRLDHPEDRQSLYLAARGHRLLSIDESSVVGQPGDRRPLETSYNGGGTNFVGSTRSGDRGTPS